MYHPIYLLWLSFILGYNFILPFPKTQGLQLAIIGFHALSLFKPESLPGRITAIKTGGEVTFEATIIPIHFNHIVDAE